MNLRRCFCALLVCVVIFYGLFSVSVSAVEIDGHTVITSWSKDGEYVEFADTIVAEGVQGPDIYMYIDIYPSEVIKKDSVFNLNVTFTSGTASSWHVAYLALYGSDNLLIDSTEDVFINDGFIFAEDVHATKDVYMIKLLVKAITPLWMVSGSDSGNSGTTSPGVFSFTIKDTICYADSGMDWLAWIESDYNTLGIYIDGSYVMSPSDQRIKESSGIDVLSDGFVTDGGIYTYDGPKYVNYSGYFLPDIQSVWLDKNTYPRCIIATNPSGSSFWAFISSHNFYYKETNGYFYWSARGTAQQFLFKNGEWQSLGVFSVKQDEIFQSPSMYPIVFSSHDIFDNNGLLYLPASISNDDSESSGDSSGDSAGDNSVPGTVTMISSFDFSVNSVNFDIGNIEDESVSGILSWVENIFNAIFDLGDYLLDGIKGLFVPTSDELAEYQNKWIELLEVRFGAVYESTSIIDDWANAFTFNGTQSSVSLPTITVDLAGIPFSFGGWDVDLVPDSFDGVVDTLKLIVNIACTFLFVNGMKKRLEGILH